jgi:ABC-2 type transport system ATP-binding protein
VRTGADAPPVEARALVKRYGAITAVDHVDLTVEAGDVYGYLGPNGAGKTTSLRMLLGLIRPTSGVARLFGRDPLVEGARALAGVAGFVEAPRFYGYLTGRANLELLARLDGGDALGRIDAALDTVDLADRQKDRVGGYSHGMRQRLGIAAALIRSPRLLLLDEPATGLDPAGMRDMRALIERLAADGITVLLSSHQLAEVEELCNRVAIVGRGAIIYEGTIAELKASGGERYRLATTDDAQALEILQTLRGIERCEAGPDGIELVAPGDAVPGISLALAACGIGVRELVADTATLEELFFRLTEGAPAPARRPSAEPEAVAL